MVKRGEVWWASVDQQRRPVLVLLAGEDDARAIIIVPPATKIEGVAEEVELGAAEGLPTVGVVRVALPRPDFIPCNWLVSLQRRDVTERAGALSPEKLAEVERLLRRARLDPEA
jgi:mRNA interferase MazF